MTAITATAGQLIRRALLLTGAVDREKALTGTEQSDGLETLNLMLSSWSINKLKIPAVTKESFTLTAGQPSYTIGESSANFSTDRPQKILSAFIRDGGNVDYILEEMNRNQYNEVIAKGDQQRPYYFYYHPAVPNGTLYFDSAPNAAETLFIDSQKDLANITDPDANLVLPSNYFELIAYHLAIRLAPEYQVPIKNEVFVVASDLMSEIQTQNSESIDAEVDYGLVHRENSGGHHGYF